MERDWPNLRIDASEATFDSFVDQIGGLRPSVLYGKMEFENADYIFPRDRAVVELKNIETDRAEGNAADKRHERIIQDLWARQNKTPLSLDPNATADYLHSYIESFRPILARTLKKTNKQIRQTKEKLCDASYFGVVILVNTEFTILPCEPMLSLIHRILKGSYSSIDCVAYTTAHYVGVPGDDLARILWVPVYPRDPPDPLWQFVDSLGASWFDFVEARDGHFDGRTAGPDVRLTGARPVASKFPWPR
jgi:hypothetical protein